MAMIKDLAQVNADLPGPAPFGGPDGIQVFGKAGLGKVPFRFFHRVFHGGMGDDPDGGPALFTAGPTHGFHIVFAVAKNRVGMKAGISHKGILPPR